MSSDQTSQETEKLNRLQNAFNEILFKSQASETT